MISRLKAYHEIWLFFRNGLTIIFLVATFFVSAATSVSGGLSSGTFLVSSDCTTPAQEQTVSVLFNEIVSPSGVSFLDFGFPQAQVNEDETDMVGVVGTETRTCRKTFGELISDSSPDAVYTCFERNTYRCTILIKQP